MVAYGRDGKRLGIFVGGFAQVTSSSVWGTFVTYGTDAFTAPDGIVVTMSPMPIYFSSGSCIGTPYVAASDADMSVWNQYWWTTQQIYRRGSVSASPANVNSKMVGDSCVGIGLISISAYSVVSIGASYNLKNSVPWTVVVE